MASAVANRVRSIISQVSGVDAEMITDDTTLQDLGLTDQQVIDYLAALMDAFGMEIPNDEAEKRVREVIEYIQSRVGTL